MVNALTPWVVLNAIVSQDTNLMSRLISASIKTNVAKEVQIIVMINTDIIRNFNVVGLYQSLNIKGFYTRIGSTCVLWIGPMH